MTPVIDCSASFACAVPLDPHNTIVILHSHTHYTTHSQFADSQTTFRTTPHHTAPRHAVLNCHILSQPDAPRRTAVHTAVSRHIVQALQPSCRGRGRRTAVVGAYRTGCSPYATALPRPSFVVHSLLSTVHRPPSTVHCPPSTVHRPPSTVHRPPFTVHRPLFTVHRSPFTVHRSPSTVHRPPSTVHCIPPTVCCPESAARSSGDYCSLIH